MKAVMLAAGVGKRLYGEGAEQPPKALLKFDDKTLLARHVEVLRACGIERLFLVVGYRRQEIEAEIAAIGAGDFVSTLFNPDFHDGPIVSLWTARDVLKSGDDVLFMDADVLYPPALLERLIGSPHASCFLYDGNIDVGEDPVRVCIREGRVVEFGKMIEGDFDAVGEWPGFMKMSPDVAAQVADATGRYVERDEVGVTYELAMRDVLLAAPPGTFGYEDITGIPWIEIDFPADLMRARRTVFPRLVSADAAGGSPATAATRGRQSASPA